MSRTYPEPLSCLPLRPRRPSLTRRLARWATRPLKTWLLERQMAGIDRNIATWRWIEQSYLAAHHDYGARQMRTLIEAWEIKLDRLAAERDEIQGRG